jgi:hypothetical protein
MVMPELELAALSAALLFTAAIIWIFSKWRHRQKVAVRKIAPPKPKSYAAVGIRPNARACSAVRVLYGKRFLANDAPAVPVIGCRIRPCPCRYIHYADRRAEDRRAQFGIGESVHRAAGTERRRTERRRFAVSV